MGLNPLCKDEKDFCCLIPIYLAYASLVSSLLDCMNQYFATVYVYFTLIMMAFHSHVCI